MQEPVSKIQSSLSIVMPVYNEEEVIETVAKDYLKILDSFGKGELIFVNDASKDKTFNVLKELAVKDNRLRIIDNEKNMGHGPTLMRGYHAATGEYVFHVDSDNQFVAKDFWLLWNDLQAQNLDVVIGKRRERKDPLSRLILTNFLKVFLLLSFGVNLPDSNSPFRLYRGSVLVKLLQYVPPRSMLPSICLAIASTKNSYKVGWIDVTHLPRLSGHSFLRSFKIYRLVFASIEEMATFKRLLHRAL